MSSIEKLINRLKTKPKDFEWNELVRVLNSFGYETASQGKTGGSRRRFIHTKYSPILLHEPHPDKILKRYQIDIVLDKLKEANFI